MALALPDRSRPALPLLQVGELSAGAFRSVPMQQVDKGPCEQFGWVGSDSADSETYLLQVFDADAANRSLRGLPRLAADMLCFYIQNSLVMCIRHNKLGCESLQVLFRLV